MHELRKTLGIHRWAPLGAALLLLFLWAPPALANGTEEINNPDPDFITIASGSGIVSAGVGLADSGSGTISFDVPGDIQQALLYWEGANRGMADFSPIMDITVNGAPVRGDAIGGNTLYAGADGSGWVTVSYRADITNLVASGLNSLSIDGLDFTREDDGAGVLVIYDDGTSSEIEVRDGNDYAHIRNAGNLQVTVPQTFIFAAATVDRTAIIDSLIGSVADDTAFLGERPNSIEVTVGTTTTTFTDELFSADDRFWDSWHGEVPVPAGETSLTVQLFSRDDDGEWNCDEFNNCPASMVWVAAAMSIEEEEGGGEGCTPGYWKQRQHFGSYPMPPYPDTLFSEIFEDAFPGMTLVQVLAMGGGGLNALGRHTVAALLNGASPDVDSDLSDGEVIAMFNEVYPGEKEDYNDLKSVFSGFNEQMCPLGRADLEEDRRSRIKRTRRVRRR